MFSYSKCYVNVSNKYYRSKYFGSIPITYDSYESSENNQLHIVPTYTYKTNQTIIFSYAKSNENMRFKGFLILLFHTTKLKTIDGKRY